MFRSVSDMKAVGSFFECHRQNVQNGPILAGAPNFRYRSHLQLLFSVRVRKLQLNPIIVEIKEVLLMISVVRMLKLPR